MKANELLSISESIDIDSTLKYIYTHIEDDAKKGRRERGELLTNK